MFIVNPALPCSRFTVRRTALKGFALCAVALLGFGCQDKPADPMTQSINSFKQMQQQLADGRKQVGSTLAALNAYAQKPGLETYNKWVGEVQATQAQADKVRDTSAVMSDRGDNFFATWDAELSGMTNTDLRNLSAEQKASTQKAYHQIAVQAPALRAAYDKFMGDMLNLQTYFDRDKSPAGVAAASTLLATSNADGVELQRQIDLQSANLAQVYSLFSQMKRG